MRRHFLTRFWGVSAEKRHMARLYNIYIFDMALKKRVGREVKNLAFSVQFEMIEIMRNTFIQIFS